MKTLLISLVLFSSISFSQKVDDKILPISKIEIDEIVKNRDNKLLLINVWATWCIPCREEFPDLVKISKEYKHKLDVIAISVDYEEDVAEKVIPFLKQNNVEFPVFTSGFKKDEELINFFKKEWGGALPGTAIYDKSGKQIIFIEGKQSYESFSSIINSN